MEKKYQLNIITIPASRSFSLSSLTAWSIKLKALAWDSSEGKCSRSKNECCKKIYRYVLIYIEEKYNDFKASNDIFNQTKKLSPHKLK